MRKPAIKYTELLALAKKYRRGNAVIWDGFFNEASARVYGFTGVGRANLLQPLIASVEKRITEENRFCNNLEELAELLGIKRATLYRYENGGLITLEKKQRPAYTRMIAKTGLICTKRVYDAKDVLKQLKRLQKRQEKGDLI